MPPSLVRFQMVRMLLLGFNNWLQLATTWLYLNRFLSLGTQLDWPGKNRSFGFWPGVKKKRKPNIYGVLSRVIISDGQAILNLIESQPRPKISSSLHLSYADKTRAVIPENNEVTKSAGEPVALLVIRTSNCRNLVWVKPIERQFAILVFTFVHETAIVMPASDIVEVLRVGHLIGICSTAMVSS